MEKILLLPFLKNIFDIVRNCPLWFQFLLIAWVVIGIYFLIRLPIEKLSKSFAFVKKILKVLTPSPRWLKLSLILWVTSTLFFVRYFSIEDQKLRSPKFITDRVENEICFTIVNPPNNIPINIVDIKLDIFSYAQFATRAVEEPRFDLYLFLSTDELLQTEKATVELSNGKTIKSVFPNNLIIKLSNNDSASFRIKLYGGKHLSEIKFGVIIEYTNNKGKKSKIISDKVYIASKESAEHIGHIDVVDYEKFIREKDFKRK